MSLSTSKHQPTQNADANICGKSLKTKHSFQSRQQFSLKERIHMIEVRMVPGNSFVSDLIKNSERTGDDLLSGITLCRSAKFLQKYGCLHTDPVGDRWKC